jgi:CHAT domain-containing protein
MAFETCEQSRARSLLDLLSEARGGVRQGVDPALLERERLLAAQLRAKSERQVEYLAKRDVKAAVIEKDLAGLTSQYRDLEAKIRAASPRYDALVRPKPLSLAEIQHSYLDAATVLLEYAPGAERSFVFVVTGTGVRTFELPDKAALETLARKAYESLAAPGGSASSAGPLRELSRAVLGPVAGLLAKKRLIIVTEGALQYVPFAALSLPSSPDTPLMVDHEIVSLPSASTLAFVRDERRQSAGPTKTLAVLADPVFSVDDPRLTGGAQNASLKPDRERSAPGFDRIELDRLPATRKEALDILALVPERERLAALDFDANRAVVTAGTLSDYRYVHFATHGLLNALHPELSSIVLSLVDRNGRPQNGFLQTTDVYNLNLKAELVVLSACQTALGQEVRGEGLIGLTRAFMYTGTPAVVASLWTVSDVSTAELMTRFYKGMLVGGLRPAAALREAQISIWKQGRWARPYYWAAFTLQGEWR